MTKSLSLLILIIIAASFSLANGKNQSTCTLAVVARVVDVTDNPAPRAISGGALAVYRLAKYSVLEVLKGRLTKTEISVAHVVLSGNELDELRVGDKVLLCLIGTRLEKEPNAFLRGADYIGSLMMIECDCKN
jgi:hypothetical protein